MGGESDQDSRGGAGTIHRLLPPFLRVRLHNQPVRQLRLCVCSLDPRPAVRSGAHQFSAEPHRVRVAPEEFQESFRTNLDMPSFREANKATYDNQTCKPNNTKTSQLRRVHNNYMHNSYLSERLSMHPRFFSRPNTSLCRRQLSPINGPLNSPSLFGRKAF